MTKRKTVRRYAAQCRARGTWSVRRFEYIYCVVYITYHSANFLRTIFLPVNLHNSLPLLPLLNPKREKLPVLLHAIVLKLPPNQPLKIKECLLRITSSRILSSVTNLSTLLPKTNVAGRNTASYFVGAYFNATVLPYAYAGIGRAEIYSYAGGGES